MAVVADKEGNGHAVLMVRSDRGDFILDNSTDAVLAWNETGYRFVKREGSDDLAWVALADDAAQAPVVASRSVAKRRAPSGASPLNINLRAGEAQWSYDLQVCLLKVASSYEHGSEETRRCA